jgi:ATP-dependent DNA helicase PIF1
MFQNLNHQTFSQHSFERLKDKRAKKLMLSQLQDEGKVDEEVGPDHGGEQAVGPPAIVLSAEQLAVISAIADTPDSILCTGRAGVGKSLIVSHAAEQCRVKGKTIAITATTGIAAVNLKLAVTLHSWLGCGLPREATFEGYWAILHKNRSAQLRMQETDVLVIDEISFLHGRMVIILDLLCRVVRGQMDFPFGGLQLVMFGDFLQLPPVVREDTEPWGMMFAFDVYKLLGFHPRCFALTKVFRQDGDHSFRDFLDRSRLGNNLSSDRRFLEDAQKVTFPDDGVLPTKLLAMNKEVDRHNTSMMMSKPDHGETKRVVFTGTITIQRELGVAEIENLGGAEALGLAKDTKRARRVESFDSARSKADAERRVEVNTNLSRKMYVRSGMQVMFRANLDADSRIANGTRGVCVGFATRADVQSLLGAQQTLVRIEADLCRELCVSDIAAHDPADLLPMVYVAASKAHFVVSEHTFDIRHVGNLVIAYRRLPFIAAWAITVHRSQGMTLDRLQISFRRRPYPAQAYVACSRVRNRASLSMEGDIPYGKVFRANAHALEYFAPSREEAGFGEVRDNWPQLHEKSGPSVTYGKWMKTARKHAANFSKALQRRQKARNAKVGQRKLSDMLGKPRGVKRTHQEQGSSWSKKKRKRKDVGV